MAFYGRTQPSLAANIIKEGVSAKGCNIMGFSNLPVIEIGAGGGIADPNTPEISTANFLSMILAGTNPKILFFQLAGQLLIGLPGWFEGCSKTDAKGRAAWDALAQAEAGLIQQQGLKPVVSVEPYDNNPQPAAVKVEAVGIEQQDSKPVIAAESFVIGQNQDVTVTWDLRSEFWAQIHGCQGEWAWTKILCNQNGRTHTAWEKIVRAQGAVAFPFGGTFGESSGSEKIKLPAGQYILLAVSTGGTNYKVTHPGLSYARASVAYAIPKKILPFLGGVGTGFMGFVKKYWPWLLVGTGGAVGIGVAAKALVGSRRRNSYDGRSNYARPGRDRNW